MNELNNTINEVTENFDAEAVVNTVEDIATNDSVQEFVPKAAEATKETISKAESIWAKILLVLLFIGFIAIGGWIYLGVKKIVEVVKNKKAAAVYAEKSSTAEVVNPVQDETAE